MKKLLLPVVMGSLMLFGGSGVSAAEASVELGMAAPFAVLAGTGVTNTGRTLVAGDLGTCPTPAITGSPRVSGTIHANDAMACEAQDDLTIAYNDAAGREPNTTYAGPTDLGGMSLVPGVYKSPTSFTITGTLTLDAGGDPNAVWIFQAGSTLTTFITGVNSKVLLINGAQACNVFWQVGSSATLGVGSVFAGTIMALTDISVQNGALVSGRLLARNGAVTLDNNIITRPGCVVTTTTTEPPTTTTSMDPTTSSSVPTTTTGPPTTTTTVSTTTMTSTPPTDPEGDSPEGDSPDGDLDSGNDVSLTGPDTPAELPKTGSPIGRRVLVAFLALGVGAVATRCGNRRSP